VKIAVTDLGPTQWDGIPTNEPMARATLIASRCGNVGREDLKSALITTLLRRANFRDFPPQADGFTSVAWLLKNLSSDVSALVPAFLDALCTPRWLGWQFTQSPCGILAAGLRLLAFYQSTEVCRRFYNPSLGIRLQNEFSQFAQADPERQSQIIQFLGCTILCGWTVNPTWFRNVPLGEISKIPVNTLPHRAGATKVEEWQYQLWLGLRAIASITFGTLAVPAALLSQTLNLWRVNLAESVISPSSAEHRINQSMVFWLERCTRNGRNVLLPETRF
jgi:hypothetical protein